MAARVLVIFCCLFIVFVQKAAAQVQAIGDAFVEGPLSQEEFARAIEADNRRVLNAPCISIVAAARRLEMNLRGTDPFPGYNCRQFADYIRSLQTVDCPEGDSHFARILRKAGMLDFDFNWRRSFAPGELCLYDNNRAAWFASLSCGNFIAEVLSVKPLMRQGTPPPVPDLTQAVRQAVEVAVSGQVAAKVSGEVGVTGQVGVTHDFERPLQVEHTGQVQLLPPPEPRRSFFKRHWWWIVPSAMAAGGAAYCFAGERRCERTTVNRQVTNIYR